MIGLVFKGEPWEKVQARRAKEKAKARGIEPAWESFLEDVNQEMLDELRDPEKAGRR